MHQRAPVSGDSQRAGVPCAEQAEEAPAFGFTPGTDPLLPVLIAAPHAGRAYSPHVLEMLRHPRQAALRLEDRLVDRLAVQIAAQTGAALLVAHAPRAMIDLNRHPDDVDWSMVQGGAPVGAVQHMRGGRAQSGLGLIPRRVGGLGELWKRPLSLAELEWRRTQVHAAYHAALAEHLEQIRSRWGTVLLIDLHSMPPLGPKTGPAAAADFVMGDRQGASCDWRLAALALEHCGKAGWRAAHNRPYAGGYVLERHARPDDGVHGMQIEVCRATYLDQDLQETGSGFCAVAQVLSEMVLRLAAVLPQAKPWAQAAE